jgi:hypothetical protein
MQGRAGGEYVIDDDMAPGRVDGLSVGEDESPGDILTSILPAEPGLRDGLMLLTKQRLGLTPGDERGELLGDPFGLIIAAVTSPAGM